MKNKKTEEIEFLQQNIFGCNEAIDSEEFSGCSRKQLFNHENVNLHVMINDKRYTNISDTHLAIRNYFNTGDTAKFEETLSTLDVILTHKAIEFPGMTFTNGVPDSEHNLISVRLVLTSLNKDVQSACGLARVENCWKNKIIKMFDQSQVKKPSVRVELV